VQLDSFGCDDEGMEAFGEKVKDLQEKLSSLFLFEITRGTTVTQPF